MSTKSHPVAWIAVLVLAAMFTAGGLWLRRDAATPPPSNDAAGTLPAGVDAGTASPAPRAKVSPTPTPAAPLPSMAAPLALIADDLRARSDAGDPDAACRLASELAYCSQHELQRADYDRWLAERQQALTRITDPAAKREAATRIEQEMTMREGSLDQIARHCEGVPPASPNDIAEQWRRAALLGNPAAMKQYASGNAFRWHSLMDSLPMLATYRGEAEAMALRVARDGDAEMMLALAAGYDPTPSRGRTLLAQSLRPDGARALALYQRVESVLDATPDDQLQRLKQQLAARRSALESLLPPAERARAERFAAEEMATWSPSVFEDARRFNGSGGQPDVPRFACGMPPGESVRRREETAG